MKNEFFHLIEITFNRSVITKKKKKTYTVIEDTFCIYSYIFPGNLRSFVI